jgi:hypothetical protein
MLRANEASHLAVIGRQQPRHVARIEALVPSPSALHVNPEDALALAPEADDDRGFPAVDARAWFYADDAPPATPVLSASARRKRADEDELVATILKSISPLDVRRTSPFKATPSSEVEPPSSVERPPYQRKHARKSINDTFPDSPWK